MVHKMELNNTNEKISSLTKEAEGLKGKLEDERQKLNDTTLSNVADRLEIVTYLNIKPRRVLKGHVAKVLCTNWSPDKRHIVSSSQVFRICSLQFVLLTHSVSFLGWQVNSVGCIYNKQGAGFYNANHLGYVLCLFAIWKFHCYWVRYFGNI